MVHAHQVDLERFDKKKFIWTQVPQKVIEDIKKVIAKESILMYPNCRPCKIHTDDSDRHWMQSFLKLENHSYFLIENLAMSREITDRKSVV